MMNTWQFILEKYQKENSVILLYVLESIGSSPGRQGFNMAVSGDGEIFGTIGGGIMEHKFVELSRALLQGEIAASTGMYHQVHDMVSKNRSGMICSGEQTILVYRIQQNDIPVINRLQTSLQLHKNGTLHLKMDGITFDETIPDKDFYFKKNDEADFEFHEKTGFKNTIHIIGGGHCSLALSRLLHRMDFHIIVYEERTNLNTLDANEYAHEIHYVDSYAELGQWVIEGKNVFVVIMTFGYRTDDIAVRALIGRQFAYIGLLGSKSKIQKMSDQYQLENLNSDWLQKIHSPIGVFIKSETVEEIAVSIAAEIIGVKNKSQ